jgi:hypothetical protein
VAAALVVTLALVVQAEVEVGMALLVQVEAAEVALVASTVVAA